MPLQTWLLFVATVFFVSATPGPNMLLAMNHGMRFGARAALSTCLGLLSALALLIIASAAGLGALMAASESLFSGVKYAGAAYLIWLGVQTWRATPTALGESRSNNATGGSLARYRTGFLVAMSNPKALIFFGALFPQFVDPALPQAPQWLTLAATFYVIEGSWQFAYAAGGARLAGWLNSPVRLKWLNRFAGGSFVGAGVALSSVGRN